MLAFERVLWQSGIERVAGVDEAGTGPMAGPVVAAAVWFPPGTEIDGVDDSKALDAATRRELAVEIGARAGGIGVGIAEVDDIDRLNVYRAALEAMRRAVLALPEPPQHLLVDARLVPGVTLPQNRFVKGDGIDFSIAAASIVAKVTRDRMMEELDALFPGYGFARHKGYCTADHQAAVRRLGPCPIHRRSYPFLRELCGGFSERFYELHERLSAGADAGDLVDVERAIAEGRASLAEEEHRKLRLTLTRRRNRGDPAVPQRAR
jgi:ribonuclease HII